MSDTHLAEKCRSGRSRGRRIVTLDKCKTSRGRGGVLQGIGRGCQGKEIPTSGKKIKTSSVAGGEGGGYDFSMGPVFLSTTLPAEIRRGLPS